MRSEPIVVFDLDGTLLRINSFHRWLAFLGLSEKSGLGWRQRTSIILLVVLRTIRLISHYELKQRVMQKIPVSPDVADVFVRTVLKKHLSPRCLEEFNRWKEVQGNVVLATAAPEIYAGALAEHLGFDGAVCSCLDENGRLSENIREVKANRVFSLVGVTDLDAVYSDHPDDIFLLQHAFLKCVVNASRRNLEEIADRFGWDTLTIIND